jgi:Flp pilus assembly protein TadG
MFVFLGFCGLAIDVAYMYTVRNQLQQALDMAAIRGAVEMISMPRVEEIRPVVLAALESNPVLGDSAVTWTWNVNIRGDRLSVADTVVVDGVIPLKPFFSTIFGVDTLKISGKAMAKLVSVAGIYCAVPYTLTDRFIDNNGDGEWTEGVDFYDPLITGFNGSTDVGQTMNMSFNDTDSLPHLRRVYGVNYGGGFGLPDEECYSGDQMIGVGTILNRINHLEGIMGLKAGYRIFEDPNARWDSSTRTVTNSDYRIPFDSPRIIKVPVHSPYDPDEVNKIMSLFINESFGDSVQVITMNILNIGEVSYEDEISFVKSARLVMPPD